MISKSDQSISSSYDLQEGLNNYNKKVGEPTQIKDYVVTFKAEEKKEYYLLVLVSR